MKWFIKDTEYICMHIECMVMHDVQNESLVFLYQLGTLSPLPSGEKEVSQTPHWSRDLGSDLSPGQLSCAFQGLSSSPISHPGIVSNVPGRLSSGSSLAARGRGDACQRGKIA